MGMAFFILAALLFSVQIFRCKPPERMAWFFAGILFFSQGAFLINKPDISLPRLFVYVLFLRTLFLSKNLRKELSSFPLMGASVFLLIMLIIIGVTDTRLTYFLKIYRPLLYFLERFFVLFLVYINVKK